jgi:hypothetical protein
MIALDKITFITIGLHFCTLRRYQEQIIDKRGQAAMSALVLLVSLPAKTAYLSEAKEY